MSHSNEPVSVHDNGGRTFDRYTAVFEDGCLLVGPTGNTPNGVCMWVDRFIPEDPEVSLSDLPEPVQRAIGLGW